MRESQPPRVRSCQAGFFYNRLKDNLLIRAWRSDLVAVVQAVRAVLFGIEGADLQEIRDVAADGVVDHVARGLAQHRRAGERGEHDVRQRRDDDGQHRPLRDGLRRILSGPTKEQTNQPTNREFPKTVGKTDRSLIRTLVFMRVEVLSKVPTESVKVRT